LSFLIKNINFLNRRSSLWVLYLFLVLFSVNVKAQNSSELSIQSNNLDSFQSLGKKYNTYGQLKLEYGGIISTVRAAGIEDYHGMDLRFGWQKRTNDVYSTINNAPKYGFGIYLAGFNDEAFGKPIGVYGFVEIPVFYSKSRWSFVYNIGLGLGFNFNYYNSEENPSNELIGSERNVYISLSIESRYAITDHWTTGLGVGFKHFSNGRTSLPNSGINLIPITIMTEYNIDNSYTDFKKENLAKFTPFNVISIFGAAGRKTFDYDEADFFKSSLGISFLRQFNYKFRYGAGFEMFYTAGSKERVENNKSDFKKLISYGFIGNWDWILTERLYVPIGFGVYLNYNEENFEKPIYMRIGARYAVDKPKKLFLGVSLKVTEFHADYIEWTIGYNFKNDPNKYKFLF